MFGKLLQQDMVEQVGTSPGHRNDRVMLAQLGNADSLWRVGNLWKAGFSCEGLGCIRIGLDHHYVHAILRYPVGGCVRVSAREENLKNWQILSARRCVSAS